MPHHVHVTAFHEEYTTPRVRYSLPRGVCHTTCTLQPSTRSMPHDVYVTAFHEEYATPRVRYSLPRGVCHTTCTLQSSTMSMPHHVYVTAFHEEYATPRVRYSLPRGVCHTTCTLQSSTRRCTPRTLQPSTRSMPHHVTLQPSTRSMPHHVYVTAFHEEYATPRVRYSLPRGVCHTTCTLQPSTRSMPHHVYVTAFHEDYATPRVRYGLPRGVCHTTCTFQSSTRFSILKSTAHFYNRVFLEQTDRQIFTQKRHFYIARQVKENLCQPTVGITQLNSMVGQAALEKSFLLI
ncbi:hypothetical protein J6590_038364 [Homalodisca vitripennis]|nr:hypothetical protein J6590_038364 [Homalodisca vitripennis]